VAASQQFFQETRGVNAIVLSHEEHEIRAIAPGCDDVLVFPCIHGTWISEELEKVTVEFEWQRRGAPPACSEDDCICPKELAMHLIQTLFGGGELDAATGETFYVFSPEGSHVATFRTEQQPS
jgi:hypothetical protein